MSAGVYARVKMKEHTQIDSRARVCVRTEDVVEELLQIGVNFRTCYRTVSLQIFILGSLYTSDEGQVEGTGDLDGFQGEG